MRVNESLDEIPEIDARHLTNAQRCGDACVACGRVFDDEDTPTSVGWFGSQDGQQVVNACFVCPADET